MSKRTIQSPGVEIREVDLALRLPSPGGTNVYTTGFAHQGPTDEVLNISSLNEFEQIYGLPRTPAERYFYHTVRAVLGSQANLKVNRLPYGPDTGDGFGSLISVLAYPATTYSFAGSGSVAMKFNQTEDVAYIIGAPIQFNITNQQYLELMNGTLSGFTWTDTSGLSIASITDLGNAAILVINKGQTSIDGKFTGYYLGIADNTNINPASAYDAIRTVQTVTQSATNAGIQYASYVSVPTSRFSFSLTATQANGDNPATNSISQVMEDKIVGYNIGTSEFKDTLNIGVFKLRQSTFSKDANELDYILEEGYNGSIGYDRQINNVNGGTPVNFFLGNIEENSRNIDILINPYISNQFTGVQLNNDGSPKKRVYVASQQLVNSLSAGPLRAAVTATGSSFGYADALFPLGAYGETGLQQKVIGNVPAKLSRALDRISNADIFNVDIIAEGGLGTIYTYTNTAGSSLSAYFDDTKTTTAIDALRTSNDLTTTTARDSYTTIFNKFATFAGPVKDGGRGDIIFVADPIRQILVSGKDSKVISDVNKNFSTDIYWALRHQFEMANTSYATVYANYFKVLDEYSGVFSYVPSSGFAAAKMVSTDFDVGPWAAPAGFNRGIINNAVDVAFAPNQRQRDDLYNVSLNAITTFPDQGIVIFGQKTLLKKPSAFDRVNVRRNFLFLEKATQSVVKFFLFENNTLFTRTRLINTLTPFFERVKAADGLYDFLIVCDERNNTPEVIDNNELVVDIYLKPVRTAEFIRVNFYATRTDASFQELIGG